MPSQMTPIRVHQTPCCCPPDCPGHPDYNNTNVTTSSYSSSSKPSRLSREASAHGPMASFYLALVAGHYDKQIYNLQSGHRSLTGSSATNQDSKQAPPKIKWRLHRRQLQARHKESPTSVISSQPRRVSTLPRLYTSKFL